METYPRGSTARLESDWRKYPGGPFEDVTGLTIKITNMTTLAVVVGPTGVGIVHPSTGSYYYDWEVSSSADMTSYQALWTGTNSQAQTVQASEIFLVGAALVSSADEIATFRLMIDEPNNVAPYTDAYLDSLLQEYTMGEATAVVWRQKAAAASALVDMSESGSSRKLSQVAANALLLAAQADADVAAAATGSYVVAIERA